MKPRFCCFVYLGLRAIQVRRYVLNTFRQQTLTAAGNHATAWPQPVIDLLKKRLACSPPCPYSFTASEAFRLLNFKLDRAPVRRWAMENKLAHAVPAQKSSGGRAPLAARNVCALRTARNPGHPLSSSHRPPLCAGHHP
jgi:hypothetical protein